MRNINRILAYVMSLCMVAAMTSCGDSENDSNSPKNSDDEFSYEESDFSFEDNVGNAVDESDKSSSDNDSSLSSHYAYYELLAEEWEKLPKTRAYFNKTSKYLNLNSPTQPFETDDGKIYCESFGILYDPITKKSEPIKNNGEYVNGYIYNTYNYNMENKNNDMFFVSAYYITKYDLNGNLVAESDDIEKMSTLKIYILDSGEVIYQDYRTETIKIISSDLQTIREIETLPQKELEHGFTEDATLIMILGVYDNKVFWSEEDENNIWVLDLNTLEWELFRNCDDTRYYSAFGKIIGKYLLLGCDMLSGLGDDTSLCMIDLDTKEIVAETDFFPYTGYAGGTFSVFKNDNGQWVRGRIPDKGRVPSNDAGVITELDILPDTTPSGIVYALNETQYVYRDEYGLFLRTYEDGENGEETLWLKEWSKTS